MDLSDYGSNMLVATERGLVHPQWIEVIEKRDALLVEADNLVNIAADNDLDLKPFREYRQKIRDVPQDNLDPFNIIWPPKPDIKALLEKK